MSSFKVGLVGLGTVGSGVVNLFNEHTQMYQERTGRSVQLAHIGARRDNPNCDTTNIKVSRDLFDVVNDEDIDLLIEVIGGTDLAYDLVAKALQNKKHVVTANKALIAMRGNELFEIAQANGVSLRFEAAVAGGIPIIKALTEGLAANDITSVEGIINGTGNFILTEMASKGREFGDVLAEAQALGYAEADPTFDVEGIDAAHKLLILAHLAFGLELDFSKMYTQGITQITPADLDYARDLGYRVKHLGIARKRDEGIELRVHPTLIAEQNLIAKVDGVLNAVAVEGSAVGPTLYSGPGAGSAPTASAVVADVLDLARGNVLQPITVKAQSVLPQGSIESAYYLRLLAKDHAGVLSKVTQILSSYDISVEALIQKEATPHTEEVPVVIITNRTNEQAMLDAIEQIEQFEGTVGAVAMIRVENAG